LNFGEKLVKKKLAWRTTCLLLALFSLYACATSKVTAFRDPGYTAARFGSIAVFSQGTSLEAAVEVERQICAKLSPTPCKMGKSILPPTRAYSADEALRHLEESGVDAVLVTVLVSDRSDTRYFGTITTSTASASATTTGTINLYGNTAFWNGSTYGSASGQAISTPVYGFSRVAFGQLGLFERSTGNIVWRGEIRIKGRGLLNVTDRAFISSATSKIAKELKDAGLIN
jgi:hypothetical protein